jgi:glycosyltransferase involved in cell wall biosynthesis
MKIAQVTPLYEAVPPRLYGGTERVVAHLTDALVDLGHEVTLFASAEAQTKARLIPVRDQAIRLDPAPLKSDLAAHLTQLAEVRALADQFDIVHFHTDMVQFPFFADRAENTLTTLHGRLDLKDLPAVYKRWPQFPLISISDDQRRPLPFANWAGTVHHGMNADLYAFSAKSEGYLAFLGRISPEKRPDRVIAPMIKDEPLIEFVGEIGDSEKSAFLGGADALLFPIDWPEPFGLVMIEAMACGTPVVAYRCGSVPEVIDDGLTGFIVDNDDQAADAILRAEILDRNLVRARFDERFSSEAMARRYVAIYERLCDGAAVYPALVDLAASA